MEHIRHKLNVVGAALKQFDDIAPKVGNARVIVALLTADSSASAEDVETAKTQYITGLRHLATLEQAILTLAGPDYSDIGDVRRAYQQLGAAVAYWEELVQQEIVSGTLVAVRAGSGTQDELNEKGENIHQNNEEVWLRTVKQVREAAAFAEARGQELVVAEPTRLTLPKLVL